MQRCVRTIFDILFPPTQEACIVRELAEGNGANLLFPRIVSECTVLLDFKHEHVRALIHESKFHGNGVAQRLLGEILARYLKHYPREVPYFVMPIPLSTERMRERGYNQVTEVLRNALIITPDMKLCDNVLVRVKNTRPQSSLPKSERAKNIMGAFCVKNPNKVSGAHILLIDDVFTTGATMRAAKLSLLPHAPASITCIALAH